jgi:hypothetical protein
MKLACADELANIFIWNSYEQKLIHELNDPNLVNFKIAGKISTFVIKLII